MAGPFSPNATFVPPRLLLLPDDITEVALVAWPMPSSTPIASGRVTGSCSAKGFHEVPSLEEAWK